MPTVQPIGSKWMTGSTIARRPPVTLLIAILIVVLALALLCVALGLVSRRASEQEADTMEEAIRIGQLGAPPGRRFARQGDEPEAQSLAGADKPTAQTTAAGDEEGTEASPGGRAPRG